jgi:hypothetical protein
MFHRYLIVSSLVVVQVAGTLALFSSYLILFHRNQEQMKIRQVDEEDLQRFDFSTENFNTLRWTEEGREFERDDSRYDVARIEKTATGFRVFAKRDIFEVLLVRFLNAPDDSTSGGLTLQLTFAQQEAPLRVQEMAETRLIDYCNHLISLYRSCSGDCLTPPPRI